MQAKKMADPVAEMFIWSKLRIKPVGDGSQEICKDKESNLGPLAGY